MKQANRNPRTDVNPSSGHPGTSASAPSNESVSRRRFLFTLAGISAGALAIPSAAMAAVQMIQPLMIENPFAYPSRDWEKVYRNLYASDSQFTFLCAPNDTHNCLLHAHVKNGVVTRISPTYKFHEATDLMGNKASQRWEPRVCQKGLALVRRFYGDRRCKKPMVRKGFKQWIDDGMPRDPKTGAVDPAKYLQRGKDPWVAVSWDEAFEYSSKALVNIARTYTGDEGKQKLLAQGYDPLMVDATQGAGTQTLKFRGGMPALGVTRIFAQYRIANALAYLDDKIRGTGADKSLGARGWDNYSWHTDLPPGHPMVTGQQTNDFDLCNVEYSKLAIVWGMNWICTKMPDSHWLTEARMKGTKVVVIACEYSATMNKADEALVVRPGTTPALALGLAQVVISEKLYDEKFVKNSTDLPLLVRVDTGKMLKASDVFADYKLAELKNGITVLKEGENAPPAFKQQGASITQAKRNDWDDYVVWSKSANGPKALNRDQFAKAFDDSGLDPVLEGTFDVKLKDGTTVKARTVFDVTKQMLDDSYTPENVEKLTWCPADAIKSLAKQIAANPEKTLFIMGMGPNQFFNNDLKDRAVFLLAALTRNVGYHGGNVGSFAGNYRASFFNGLPQYMAENPFDVTLDADKPAKVKQYWKPESVHYFNHGDQILRAGKNVLTGKSHMPTPTKSIHVSNSNSLIGNVKGHYDLVVNTLSRVEFVAVNEWWWTTSCEYADVVFPVDSWAEFKIPDMTMSVTNPFVYVYPRTPLERIHDTKADIEVAAGLCEAIGKQTSDDRYTNYWKFVKDGAALPYIQRILNGSNAMKGFDIKDLEAKAQQGIPAIINTRTYPKSSGWEQSHEGRPYFTRSGRLEFYRDENEFIDAGENMVVHREPIDSTFYEPNVIVSKTHPLLKPKTPADYGVDPNPRDGDKRQHRNVIKTVEELLKTEHPLNKEGHKFIFHTPKYRHGAHTTGSDIDIVAVWFGPFGDMHRTDKRQPASNEMYLDMNPLDAKELGLEEGDYIWIDADPEDRPFRNKDKNPEAMKFARLLARARFYPGTPRGVTRMWHNAYAATPSTVLNAEKDPTGLAKNPDTGYQSQFRSGSHQSATRGYIKPTMMTDSLNVKALLSQQVVNGFVPDVHCPTGAPREAMVKITKAEAGGLDGKGIWRPATLGVRPTYESESFKKFLNGAYVKKA